MTLYPSGIFACSWNLIDNINPHQRDAMRNFIRPSRVQIICVYRSRHALVHYHIYNICVFLSCHWGCHYYYFYSTVYTRVEVYGPRHASYLLIYKELLIEFLKNFPIFKHCCVYYNMYIYLHIYLYEDVLFLLTCC